MTVTGVPFAVLNPGELFTEALQPSCPVLPLPFSWCGIWASERLSEEPRATQLGSYGVRIPRVQWFLPLHHLGDTAGH